MISGGLTIRTKPPKYEGLVQFSGWMVVRFSQDMVSWALSA